MGSFLYACYSMYTRLSFVLRLIRYILCLHHRLFRPSSLFPQYFLNTILYCTSYSPTRAQRLVHLPISSHNRNNVLV